MNLIEIRGHDFFTQFVCLGAWERDLQAGKDGNQRLRNSVWISPMRMQRLDLTQAACDQQKAMRALRHPPKTIYEDAPIGRAGMTPGRRRFNKTDRPQTNISC